jgi:hypothetical protein
MRHKTTPPAVSTALCSVRGLLRGWVSAVRAAGASDPLDPVIPLSRHQGGEMGGEGMRTVVAISTQSHGL